MITTQIRFATFNIGSGDGDYASMLGGDKIASELEEREFSEVVKGYLEKPEAERTRDEHRSIREERKKIGARIQNEVEISTATKLADSHDVINLQEVLDLDRAFIKTLKDKGFEIILGANPRGKKSDIICSTAIAIRKELFSQVSKVSIDTPDSIGMGIHGREIAAIKTTLANSNISLSFASLHSNGFRLLNPQHNPRDHIENDNDQENRDRATIYANQSIRLMKAQKADFAVIAGDMNNNPENHREPFLKFQKSGYTVLEPSHETNIFHRDPSYKERKIDFIFAQKSSFLYRIARAIASIFFSTVYISTGPASTLNDFSFTPKGNCSDHKPVSTTITITRYDSLISRFFNRVFNRG